MKNNLNFNIFLKKGCKTPFFLSFTFFQSIYNKQEKNNSKTKKLKTMDKLTALKLINKKLEIEIRKAQNELNKKQFNLLEFKQNLSNSIDKWMLEQLHKEQEKRAKNNSNINNISYE